MGVTDPSKLPSSAPAVPRLPSDLMSQPPVMPPTVDMSASSDVATSINLDPVAITKAATEVAEKIGVTYHPPPVDQWANITAAQDMFAWLHEQTGSPWWLCIAAVTIAVRVCTFPVTLRSIKNGPRLYVANTELKGVMEKLKAQMSEANARGDANLLNDLRMEQKNLMSRTFAKYGAKPFAMLGSFFLMPIFMTGFFALERLGSRYDISQGGFGWITDLSVADPFLITPVLSAATMLLMIELGVDPNTGQKSFETQPMMKNVFRGLAGVSLLVTYHFPAALFVYWTTSNMFSLAQSFAMRQKSFRTLLGVPTLEQVRAEAASRNTASGASSTTTEAVVVNTNRRSRTNVQRAADRYVQSQGRDATNNSYTSAPPTKKK